MDKQNQQNQEGENGNEGTEEKNEKEKSGEKVSPSSPETSGNVSEAYWKKEAKEAFAARDRLAEKLRKREEKDQKEGGDEYKTLYEDLKTKTADYQALKDQVDAQNRKVQESLGKLEEKLSDGFRPEYERYIKKLSEAERFEWLEEKFSLEPAKAPQLSEVPKAGESGLPREGGELKKVPFQNASGRISGILEKLRK